MTESRYNPSAREVQNHCSESTPRNRYAPSVTISSSSSNKADRSNGAILSRPSSRQRPRRSGSYSLVQLDRSMLWRNVFLLLCLISIVDATSPHQHRLIASHHLGKRQAVSTPRTSPGGVVVAPSAATPQPNPAPTTTTTTAAAVTTTTQAVPAATTSTTPPAAAVTTTSEKAVPTTTSSKTKKSKSHSSTDEAVSSSSSSSSTSTSLLATPITTAPLVIITLTSIVTNPDGSFSTSVTAVTPTSAASQSGSGRSSSSKTYAIVGGVLGALAGIALLVVLVYKFAQYRGYLPSHSIGRLGSSGDGKEIKWPELQPDGQTVSTGLTVLNPQGTRRTGGAGISMGEKEDGEEEEDDDEDDLEELDGSRSWDEIVMSDGSVVRQISTKSGRTRGGTIKRSATGSSASHYGGGGGRSSLYENQYRPTSPVMAYRPQSPQFAYPSSIARMPSLPYHHQPPQPYHVTHAHPSQRSALQQLPPLQIPPPPPPSGGLFPLSSGASGGGASGSSRSGHSPLLPLPGSSSTCTSPAYPTYNSSQGHNGARGGVPDRSNSNSSNSSHGGASIRTNNNNDRPKSTTNNGPTNLGLTMDLYAPLEGVERKLSVRNI